MAVALSIPPSTVQLSRNATEVEFTCPDKFITVGAKHIRKMIITGYPTDEDDSLKLAWSNEGVAYEQTFTFKTTPDVNAYEIIKYSGAGIDAWLQVLAAGLMGHPNVSRDWEVEVYSANPVYGLIFYARFEDAATLEFTATGFTITPTTLTAGAVAESQPEYRLSAWLYVGNSTTSLAGDMQRTGEIEVDADANKKVKLNLQRYLADYLDEPEVPTSLADQYVACTRINRPAFVLFGQKWNTPYERQKQFKTATFRVLKGGMEEATFANARDILALTDVIGGIFLTLRTDRVIDFDGQKDWLFFYAKSSVSNCYARVVIYREVGDPLALTLFSGAIEAGTTYQFRCDAEFALPGVIPGAYKYEIWLYDVSEGVDITNKVTFWHDSNYLDIFFEYENSLGGIESWKMNGERSQIAAISKETYENELPFRATADVPTIKSYNELVGKSLDCSTGPLNATDAIAFADFLRSRHVWIRNGAFRIPIRISGGTAVQGSKNLAADYSRGGKFVAEISLSANVSKGSVM